MAKRKSYYTLDEKNKVIIIDKSVKPSANDFEMLKIYGTFGYTIHEKRIVKANSGARMTDAEIREILKNDKSALDEYIAIKEGAKTIKSKKGDEEVSGFMAGRRWVVAYLADKEKNTKESKAK